MGPMLIPLLTLATALQATQPVPRFIFENARTAHYSTVDGTVVLRGGRGWLRYSRVLLDFELTFEFKLETSDTDAGVVLRSWVGRDHWPDAGYRLVLPREVNADPRALLTARRRKVQVLRAGDIPAPAGEWHTIRIRAERQRVSVHAGASCASETCGSKNSNQIEGVVGIEAVVLPDGSVGRTKVVKPLDENLDRAALAAVRLWHFKPGTRFGKPAAIRVQIELTFSLR